METELSPARHGLVEGRDIFVFDGLVSEADLSQYVEGLARAPFARTEYAKPETAEYKHWVSELPLANLVKLPLWPATERALACVRPGESYRPLRAYTNYAAFGDVLYAHTDCRPDQRELTAMWFLTANWEREWGGETVFFDTSGDAMFCVSPKPGRLVMFDGAITHAGRPPSRICFAPRYTFAIKLGPAAAA